MSKLAEARITGHEVAPDGQSEREFAMYSTEQYMAPTGPYDTVETIDGSSWYRQYAQPTVEKTPYKDGDDKIRYEERIVLKCRPSQEKGQSLMSEENRQQQSSAESTVAGAAKTEKPLPASQRVPQLVALMGWPLRQQNPQRSGPFPS
jgi:hypothetical protein